MSYETITVKPLAGALGAEIAGVDLRQPLSNQQRSEIHDAFLAHCAIYIRDQELGGADLLRYARYFAEPAYYPFAEGLPDYPEIFEIRKEPDQRKNVGARWHSDTTISRNRRSRRCSMRARYRPLAATRWSRTSIWLTKRYRPACGACSTA